MQWVQPLRCIVFLKLGVLFPWVKIEFGGGGQQASCLVSQQAVEFPQVLTSLGLHE